MKDFLIRNPNFCLIWFGQILSQSGSRMFQITLVWSLVERHPEKGGFFIGIFMVLSAIPSIIFVRNIGSLIDIYKRKNILIFADLFASIIVIITSFFIEILYMVFLLGFFLATIQAFIDPTLNKSIEELVYKKDISTAISIFATTQSLSNFFGAMIGALLIDRLGINNTIILCGFLYFISSSCSFLSVFRFRYESPKSLSGDLSQFLKKEIFIKLSSLGFGFTNFFLTPTLVILPLYVKHTLFSKAESLGFLEGAIWFGILFGSLSAKFVTIFHKKSVMAGVLLFMIGALLLIPSFIVSFYLYFIILFFSGTAIGINNVKFISFFQSVTPSNLKGRFFAFIQAMVGFMFPASYFIFGFLSQNFIPQTLCFIQGVGICALSVYFFYLLRYEH